MILVLVAAFLVLLFAGIPIAYILGLVALLGISQLNSISLITVVQKMFTGLNSFTLLAVPLQCVASSLGSEEFRYLAGMITSVSTLSPYLNTRPCHGGER